MCETKVLSPALCVLSMHSYDHMCVCSSVLEYMSVCYMCVDVCVFVCVRETGPTFILRTLSERRHQSMIRPVFPAHTHAYTDTHVQ